MAMTSDVKKGMVILFNNEPTLILDREFYKPGKGGAYNRLKLKGLLSGKIVNQTLRSGESVEEVDVVTKSVSYSYSDEEAAYFMDSETYEMVSVSLGNINGGTDFLITDAKYTAMFYEEKPISLNLPAKITLEVTETALGGDRGNTSGNPTKEATLETGAIIQVPLFVNKGEKVVINTESKLYVSKA